MNDEDKNIVSDLFDRIKMQTLRLRDHVEEGVYLC